MNVIERTFAGAGRAIGAYRAGLTGGDAKQHPGARLGFDRWTGDAGVPAAEPLLANARAYQASGWIYTAVKAIASRGGSLPLRLLRKSGRDRSKWEQLFDHPILDVLDAPNPDAEESDIDFLEALFSDWELAGNWFVYVQRDDSGNPDRMYRLRPDRMKVVPSATRRIAGYLYTVNGESQPFDVADVTMSRTFNPLSDHSGQSTLQAARLATTLDVQSLLWNIGFFKRGAVPGGALMTDDELEPEQIRVIRTEWNKIHQGRDKAHEMAILHGGLKYEPIGIPHKDMEYVLQRKMSREEMLAVFGVPPAIAGVYEYANYANSREQRKLFWHGTMIPKLRKMQKALTRMLCQPIDRSLLLEFDLTGVHALIEDALERAKVDSELAGRGIVTINEIRRDRGMGPVAWGDVWWNQIQYVPVSGPESPIAGELSWSGPAASQDGSAGAGPGQGPPAATPFQGRRLYDDVRKRTARDAAWQAVLLPSLRQHAKKTNDVLAKQQKEVVRKIQADSRSLTEVRELIDKRARHLAEDAGESLTAEHTKEATLLEIASWLFDREYWQTGAIRAVHPTLLHAIAQAATFAILEVGMETEFDLMNPRVQEALREKEFIFAQEWNDTTLEKLRGTLAEGVGYGENQEELIARVQDAFGHRKNNAPVVAQTEVGAVSNAGAEEGWRQTGVVGGKEWHAGGPNPRDHHLEANGQVVGLNQEFFVGGELLRYPCDPKGQPRNICNCHCSELPVLYPL